MVTRVCLLHIVNQHGDACMFTTHCESTWWRVYVYYTLWINMVTRVCLLHIANQHGDACMFITHCESTWWRVYVSYVLLDFVGSPFPVANWSYAYLAKAAWMKETANMRYAIGTIIQNVSCDQWGPSIIALILTEVPSSHKRCMSGMPTTNFAIRCHDKHDLLCWYSLYVDFKYGRLVQETFAFIGWLT